MSHKPRLVKLTVLVPAEVKRALERLARTKALSVGTCVRYMLLASLEAAKQREAPREEKEEGTERRPD